MRDQAGEVWRAMIRILLVDDNERFRKNFVLLLEQQPDTEVVAQAGSLAQARKMLWGVDVALIDRVLPDGDGLELIGELREASPGAKVLAMSLTMEEMHKREAREAGADGILDKIAPPEQIAVQIRAVREGTSRRSNGYLDTWEGKGAWQRYLATEREALLLRANGLLAHSLCGVLPGESREDLERIAAEDERLAREGLVKLLGEDGEISHKHLDDLTPDDVPARRRAEVALAGVLREHIRGYLGGGRPARQGTDSPSQGPSGSGGLPSSRLLGVRTRKRVLGVNGGNAAIHPCSKSVLCMATCGGC
jgi:DNA-binding NarL/FixJ family response regulator